MPIAGSSIRPRKKSSEHVEADVEEAGVEEAAGQQPVPLAFGDRGAEEAEFRTIELPRISKPPLPVAISARKTSDVERDQDEGRRGAPKQRLLPTPRTTRVRWLAHSGQRMPTGVGVMQSGQIGRPQ